MNENGYYRMYASDGTEYIYEIDGETMTVVRSIKVRQQNGYVMRKINELEYIDGYIYANVWYVDTLLKIDPQTGTIVKQWDLSILMRTEWRFQKAEKGRKTLDCLNGIAYDSRSGSIFLTGKLYHLVFEVELS